MKQSAFFGVHPILSFLFFTLVILCSMFFMHPICLLISVLLSLSNLFLLKRNKVFKVVFFMLLPVSLSAVLINPLFSHQGVTILAYFPSGNPLTLESICYGLAAGGMLSSVMCWFSCFHEVMTSDKLVYLFGKLIPAGSLLLSMVLRFVPLFGTRRKVMSYGRASIQKNETKRTLLQKVRQEGLIWSAMITWSMEHGISIADSMVSRGYGRPGRTAFSIYRFDRRDFFVLCYLILTGGGCILAGSLGAFSYHYYPNLKDPVPSGIQWIAFLAYFLLSTTPIILTIWEGTKWNISKSKI